MKEAEKRMNLKNNYFILENAVTNRFCDHVIEYGKYLKEQVATTWGYNPDTLSDYDRKELEKTRKSKITWMSDNWMYRQIQPVIHEVNALAGWNFQWSMTESFQFTKYEGNQKQHYDWHTDSGDADDNGLTRKISASLILANDDEYEGGDSQICIPNPNQNKIINIKLKQKGTMIFFPSFVWHRVVPVTKGTRYSLVCWSKGNLFK